MSNLSKTAKWVVSQMLYNLRRDFAYGIKANAHASIESFLVLIKSLCMLILYVLSPAIVLLCIPLLIVVCWLRGDYVRGRFK